MTTTAIALPSAATPARHEAGWLRLYKRIFSDSPEHSLRLRLTAVTMFCWSAVSLWLIGAGSWVPLAVIPATVVGHSVAYRDWRRRVPFLAIVVALVIMGVGIAMRFELVLAMRGERVPMAHFLLIAGAAASFEARTRGGLYTHVIFSAIVMFFTAELAFGNEFSLLLGGYLALTVTFLATAHFVDQARDAGVQWFRSRLSAVAYWAATALLVGAASVAAFLVLPWDESQTPDGAQFAILPVTGGNAGNGGQAISSEQMREIAAGIADATAPQRFDTAGKPESSGPGAPVTVAGAGVTVAGSSPAQSIPAGDAVAYVRSSVASYWREGIFDTFVPGQGEGRWLDTLDARDKYASIFTRPDDGFDDSGRYLQTFFAQTDLGNGFVTGYNPTGLAVPRDSKGRAAIAAGSTYQVVSQSPVIDPGTLRLDRAGWERPDYSHLPEELAALEPLARALVAGAETDFDRAAAIAGYLHGLEYDAQTPPLEQSGSIMDFVLGNRAGTALDFATAMTMMARATGLQSRVATGYLPGQFNPYSGASEIRGRDAHAWSEVLFEEAGWVPFEAAPRPDLPSAGSLKKSAQGGLGSLLDNRIGDDLARAAAGAPTSLKTAFEWIVRSWPAAMGLAGALIVVAAAWWYRRSRSKAGIVPRFAYSGIAGDGRREALAAFARAERALVQRGFRRRKRSEPYERYALLAAAYAGDAVKQLKTLAAVASRAAYSLQPLDDGDADRARRAAIELGLVLKG